MILNMNNKGFTLIEIIIVIAIIALLALLIAPNAIGMINKNKIDNYKNLQDSIRRAADSYLSDERYENDIRYYKNNYLTPEYCNSSNNPSVVYTKITLKDLVDGNYLTEGSNGITNPCTNEEMGSDKEIRITLDCKTKKFTYDISDFLPDKTSC